MTTPSTASTAADGARAADWARLAGVLVLALLARMAFRDEYGYIPLVGDIDTAIHEFGHMLFMPFGIEFLGDTMMILGGSLVQVVFPLVFVAYFLARGANGARRDPYAAMVCLWWSSINLLGVAIYCADSRAGKLMLLNGATGQDSDAHDWKNLLTRWHQLDHDTLIAGRMRAVAVLLCAGSLLGAAWIVLVRRPVRRRRPRRRSSAPEHVPVLRDGNSNKEKLVLAPRRCYTRCAARSTARAEACVMSEPIVVR